MATVFCKHYRAMFEHDTCRADVRYDTFQGLPFDKRPCFASPGEVARPGCELVQLPTAEDLAERKRLRDERLGKIGKARAAIVAHLGGPWKRGLPAASGALDCPVCGGQQSLRFSRSGYNGHIIHAACQTDGCVRWME